MAKTIFEWREDKEYGGEGWILKGFPNFNVSSGLGIAHDTMEHFADGDGEMGAEMEAFGAMLYIRGESGWFYNKPGGRSFAESLGDEISRFLEDVRHGVAQLRDPGKTYRLSDETENELQELLRRGIRVANHNLNEDLFDLGDTYTSGRDTDRMLGWMRKGYRRAVKRYAGNCSDELAYAFDQVVDATKRRYGEYGDELHVNVNNKTLKVTVRQVHGWDSL